MTPPFWNPSWKFSQSRRCRLFTQCIHGQKSGCKKTICYRRWKSLKNVLILPPLGYLDFLVLMKNCRLIITDSGGIQEEATAPNIRKQVLVIRLSTERQEAVEAGFAKVVGTDAKVNLGCYRRSPWKRGRIAICFSFWRRDSRSKKLWK